MTRTEVLRRMLLTGTALYGRAFGKAIAGIPLDEVERQALRRAMTPDGATPVPFWLDPTVVRILDEMAVRRLSARGGSTSA